MAKGVFSASRGHPSLLTIGGLLLMLVIGAAGFGRVEHERLQEVGTVESNPLTLTVFPHVASPWPNQDGWTSSAWCHRGEPVGASPGATARSTVHEDPRRYLSKMAALPYQRRSATASALDPYQASLDPAVYFVNDAPLPTMNGDPTRITVSQGCQVP